MPGYSLIILPDRESGAVTAQALRRLPAVILAVNNNPMCFSDRNDSVSRRRVILTLPEVIPAKERDPQLMDKISTELAIIVRHLMQRFSRPDDARELLQAQQTSGEALEIKRQADPVVDFCGYLMPLSTPNRLFIGNVNIRPINSKRYLYHAYLSFIESRGHQHPLSLTAFGQVVPQTLKEYERVLLKRRMNNGI